jgi:N utilization substance protein B
MQVLYELDINENLSCKLDEALSELNNILDNHLALKDKDFAIALIKDVLERREVIDGIIAKAAPDWPIEKIGVVDRNILRIGLCELIFGEKNNIPPKVAIDQAIEVAKEYGGENSGKFINGVLGAVYKELGEPNKDFKTTPRELITENKAGVIVYKIVDGELSLAFVHDVFGYWTLSRGGIEEGETKEECAKREAKEEMGLDVEIGKEVHLHSYTAHHPEKGRINKVITYFLAKALNDELKLGSTGGLDSVKWFKESEIAGLKIYSDLKPVINKGISMIER